MSGSPVLSMWRATASRAERVPLDAGEGARWSQSTVPDGRVAGARARGRAWSGEACRDQGEEDGEALAGHLEPVAAVLSLGQQVPARIEVGLQVLMQRVDPPPRGDRGVDDLPQRVRVDDLGADPHRRVRVGVGTGRIET